MKKFLIFFVILLVAVFQAMAPRFNLIFLALMTWTVFVVADEPDWEKAAKDCLLVAFLAGIFVDLAIGNILGATSLGLIIFEYLLLLYARKLNPLHPLLLPIFVFISGLLWSRIELSSWFLPENILLAVAAFTIRTFLIRIFGLGNRGKILL